jgi:predicted permease
VVLVVAGLFTRSLSQAERINLGFDPNYVVNFTMDPLLTGYHRAQGTEFFKNLLDRLRALPGVASVSTAYSAPMSYMITGDALTISGYETPPGQPRPVAHYNIISSNYFETMHIALRNGRAFTDADDDRTVHVAIVSEAFVRRYWPDQDPIGRTFKMASDSQHVLKVVGVAADVRYRGITGPVTPYFYIPFAQRTWDDSWQTVHIRTNQSPKSIVPELERVLASFAPGQPVWDIETMNQALYTLQGLLIFQVGAGLAALLGTVGLILTIVGVYGVVSYDTSRRTHEIGIRMALGAQRRDVLRLVLEQGAKLALFGVAIGIVAALALTRLMRGLLYGVSPTDPATFAGVASLLISVALLACYIPARRAMRVDPAIALRHE